MVDIDVLRSYYGLEPDDHHQRPYEEQVLVSADALLSCCRLLDRFCESGGYDALSSYDKLVEQDGDRCHKEEQRSLAAETLL